MANLNINLYPPQIPTYQDAFLKTSTCRIYFSLSLYNSYEDVKSNAQVTIANQNTNKTVLSASKYPNEIKLCTVQIDNSSSVKADKYYIEIEPSDLQDGFEINQYYKVQIRFTSSLAPTPPSTAAKDKWFVDNADYFSEWSTVCLVRAISKPYLELQNFSTQEENTVISTSTLQIVGTLSFADSDESDSLNYYRVRLYDENNTLLEDSEILYTNAYNNPNGINYTLKATLKNGSKYTLTIEIQTKNYYSEIFNYPLIVVQSYENPLNTLISLESESEAGRVKITIAGTTDEKSFTGDIILRRASSKDNFVSWEDVYIRHYDTVQESRTINFIWYDYTIESGIWYKYCAQKRDNSGQRGTELYAEKPVLVLFEDMFLAADNKQLRIRYNQTVNSLKQNIAEARSETLGSKYPFIRRNGYINYRSMTISGLITIFDDFNDIFTSKAELYGEEAKLLYESFNDENRIDNYNDYILEREFREKVIDFLYQDNIKLLRTLTEGNLLVKLMNISLSPQTVLGRQIYSFSAEAYEVLDYTYDNILSSGIIIREEEDAAQADDSSEVDIEEKEVLGQIDLICPTTSDIITLLKEKYSNYLRLSALRLQFQEDPYFIAVRDDGALYPATKEETGDVIYYGYLIKIDQKDILVSSNGTYVLLDNDIDSLLIEGDADVFIDYIAVLKQEGSSTNVEQAAAAYTYKDVVGQLYGQLKYQQSLYNMIKQKYNYSYNTFNQKIIYIGNIQIEANPNTVVYIKNNNDEPQYNLINQTCLLSIQDNDLNITDIYFGGIYLTRVEDSSLELVTSYNYYEEPLSYPSLQSIAYPKANHVYKVDNIRYIWYNESWKIFNENDIVKTDVEGIVNYYCRILVEVFAQ